MTTAALAKTAMMKVAVGLRQGRRMEVRMRMPDGEKRTRRERQSLLNELAGN